MRRAIAFAVLLLSFPAAAATVTSLEPKAIFLKSGEWFLTARGTGLSTADQFIYFGPSGLYGVDVSAVDPFGTFAIAWLPQEVINRPGTYTVTVTVREGRMRRP